MARSLVANEKPEVNKDLKGFEIGVNEFGEIVSTLSVDEMNRFLNKNVVDKKLKDRTDILMSEDDFEDDLEADDEDDDDAFDDFEDDFDDEDLDDLDFEDEELDDDFDEDDNFDDDDSVEGGDNFDDEE